MGFKYSFRPYTKQDIESLNGSESGVYGIATATEWVYVGKGDIRTRMLAHYNGDNPCIKNKKPTQWTGEVFTDSNAMDAREKQLILELQPSCNKKVG